MTATYSRLKTRKEEPMDSLSIQLLRNNLRAYRVKNDLTQDNVADRLGVCTDTIKNWERNPNKMTFEKLVRLANLYKCEVKDFFL